MPGSIATLSICIAIAPSAGVRRAQQPPVRSARRRDRRRRPAIRSPSAAAWTAAGCASSNTTAATCPASGACASRDRARCSASSNDQGGDYVEITGDLDLGPGDRLDARRKVKVADKTTISIGASAEQVSGPDTAPPDPTLVVDAFTALGERCPKTDAAPPPAAKSHGVGGVHTELLPSPIADRSSFVVVLFLLVLDRQRREHAGLHARIRHVPALDLAPEDAIQPRRRRRVRDVEAHLQRIQRGRAGRAAGRRQARSSSRRATASARPPRTACDPACR